MRKRIFDLILAVVLSILFSVPMICIALFIMSRSRGPAIFWTDRIGRHNVIFRMPKFRTMKIGTPQVATHLMKDPGAYLIPGGDFLRRSSLDELPQLFSVIMGDMTFVGPRPALFNQDDLVALRTQRNVHTLVPGITGWAQINGRDELPIPAKVDLDVYYFEHRSFGFDLKILWMTAFKVLKKEGVTH